MPTAPTRRLLLLCVAPLVSSTCMDNATLCAPIVAQDWLCWTGVFVEYAQQTCPVTCGLGCAPRPRCANVPSTSGTWSDGNIHLNVNYSTTYEMRQAIDIYETTAALGTTPVPLAIFVHGGSWAGKNRTLRGAMDALREDLLHRGISVASVGYHLTGDPYNAKHPSQIDDIEDAIQYLKTHAQEYNLDPDRFVAIGQSAGGHLVSLLGTRNYSSSSPHVVGIVNLYGPTYVRPQADPTSAISRLLDCDGRNLSSSECEELAISASPYDHVDSTDVPFLHVHGTADDVVNITASQAFHAALQLAGVNSTLIVTPGAGHSVEGMFGVLTGNDPELGNREKVAAEWIEDHAWCNPYAPPAPLPSPPPPPVCIDDPPSPYTATDCEANSAKCDHWNPDIRQAIRQYCQLTCNSCTGSQTSFTLAQSSSSASSGRMLSHEAGSKSPSEEVDLIRSRCGSVVGADQISFVQTELTRLIEGLQADGSVSITLSGSLSDGDWRAEVRVVANEECAAIVDHLRPQASLIIAILRRLGTSIVYQVHFAQGLVPNALHSPCTSSAPQTCTVPLILRTHSSWQRRCCPWLRPMHSAFCPPLCHQVPLMCRSAPRTAYLETPGDGLEAHALFAPLSLSTSSCPSEGMCPDPETIGLLVTTVVGWLLALALGAVLFRRKPARASPPSTVTSMATVSTAAPDDVKIERS